MCEGQFVLHILLHPACASNSCKVGGGGGWAYDMDS